MMVTTVTLNPALDYHITLPGLAPGEIQWFSHSSFSPGGKGINVSLLLSSLGVETRALGIAAGFTGREIARLLEERGCPADMVFLEEGCSRVNVKLQTPGGEETAFNGPGPDIPPQAVAQLLGKLSTLGPEDVLVLSGSLPQGLPASLPYHPFLIKPNLEELCQLFQAEGPLTPLEAKEYAKELQRMGARNVVVSLGEKGALLLEESGRCLGCRSPRGQAVSTVGAGDSLVAGFLYGCQLHGTLEGGLKWGVAAGAATAFQEGIATGSQVKAQFPAVGNPHPL